MFLVDDANTQIKKAIIRSQHTQRNWDLEQMMPEDDIELLVHAATNCPSKQNHAFYKLHVITDRSIIEKVHAQTHGINFTNSQGEQEVATNSQTLAHVLFAFEDVGQRSETYMNKWKNYEKADPMNYVRDLHNAVGVAAGYLNVVASMLGYRTGCCACGDLEGIRDTLEMEGDICLMMGIGIGRTDMNRRVHHVSGEMMPTHKKEEISVTYRR